MELHTGTPSYYAGFKFCSQVSKMLLWIFISFINLFPEYSFPEKGFFLVKSGVADENPLLVCGIHFSLSHGSKMIFRTCPSFINLFPDHFFFEKIKFLYKWSCRQETPIFVLNVVFACSSASGMHHYFTVQFYTTWRQFSKAD